MDFVASLLACLAAAAAFWLYLKVCVALDNWWEETFGISWRQRRTPKVEIQTLFHGNTKDQDQI